MQVLLEARWIVPEIAWLLPVMDLFAEVHYMEG